MTLDKQPDTWSNYDGYTGTTGGYDSDDGENNGTSGIKQPAVTVPTGAEIFQNIVRTYVQSCNEVHVLSMIISSFSSTYYASTAQDLVTLVSSSCGCSRSAGSGTGSGSGSGSGSGGNSNSNSRSGSGSNTPCKGRSSSSASYTSPSSSSFPTSYPTSFPFHTQSLLHTQPHTQSLNTSVIEDRANVHSGRAYALAALGKQLTQCAPPEKQKRVLLREVWKIVGCTNSLSAYVACAGAWLVFARMHCRSDTEASCFVLFSLFCLSV